MKSTLRLAGIFGFLAVALGAFGAHMLKPQLESLGTLATWQTAVLYHLVHAAALLAIALGRPVPRWVAPLFAIGIVLFSGSLYALALVKIKFLGPITPIGGLFLLAGWLALIFAKEPAQK